VYDFEDFATIKMLGATAVNLRYFFYPIGNNPAVNVLQDRFRSAPGISDDGPVKVLLLACGDPRNLLFSLWCESSAGMTHAEDDESLSFPISTADKQTKWEFTCCDIDAAVLGV
jgi:hypothetical protein